MLKPICVPCQRFYRMKKGGFRFTEGMPRQVPALPGTDQPERWQPYKLWLGDLWRCESCGHEIISGVGFNPVAERHHENFEGVRTSQGYDQFQVNDC